MPTPSPRPDPGPGSGTGSGSGTASRITCAFVPLTPNPDTAARRGRPVSGHARASVRSDTAPLDQSTNGDGSSACRVRGSTPCRSACTILITPVTPAAAPVCPMFDLAEPRYRGRSAGRSCPYVSSSDWASIGSPSRVPVPCASTASTSDADSRASASAARITRRWDGPLGADNPLDAPSWFTAEPRTTASTGCPLRRASDSRSTTSTPTASDQPVPSAPAPKALQRPSGASARCRLKSIQPSGVASTETPQASASVDSPDRSDRQARCSVTSDDEQAVSTVRAGPSKPKEYAMRPDRTLAAMPVSRCASMSSPVAASSSP